MDKINGIQITESLQAQFKDLFKEFSSDALYDIWADTFEVDSVTEKEVIISYHGNDRIKNFTKNCRGALTSAAKSAFGESKKIKILSNKYSSLSPETRKNLNALKFFVVGMLFVCIAVSIIVVLCNYIGNRTFRETFYTTSSIKINNPVRVIQLSDLHCTSYGKNNEKLLQRIEELNPDIIICTGDIVDSTTEDVDYAVTLGEALAKIAPSYYIYGNNEVESVYDFHFIEHELDTYFGFDQTNRDESALLKIKDTFAEQLEAVGIKVLKNEKDTITVNNTTIDVYGVLNSNPSSFWSYSEKAFLSYINEDTDNFKITAIHEPILFEVFNPDFWGDLILCGHTHGGVMRIPMLGPLYTEEGGLFPGRNGHFVYGRYDAAGCPLIVSSGLENKNILRINNQPELVIVDINKF